MGDNVSKNDNKAKEELRTNVTRGRERDIHMSIQRDAIPMEHNTNSVSINLNKK